MALTRPKIWDLDTTIEAFVDPITVLHQGASSANVDVGFLMNRANGLVSNVAIYWSESGNTFVTAFTTSTGVTNSNIVVTSYAGLTVGNLITSNGIFWANGVAYSSGGGSSFTGGYVPNQTTFGANLVANSGVASSSSSTGALVVVGGAGISQNLYLGGTNLYFSAPSTNAGIILQATSAFPYSVSFSGTSSYLTIGSLTLGSGDFTVEGWYNISNINSDSALWSQGISDNANSLMLWINPGNYQVYGAAAQIFAVTSTVPALNTWVHYAVVRSGSTITLYINGTAIGAGSSSANFNSSTFQINRGYGGVGRGPTGYQSNFRVANYAVYTGNFTVPTSPLTAISGTQLLTLNAATIVDGSTNAYTITNNGGLVSSSLTPGQAAAVNWTYDGSANWNSSVGVNVQANTTSVSTTTGALLVKGGAGIAGNVWAGNLITAGGVFWANGAVYSTGGGGGGSPAGATGSIQYNNSGSFGATDITYFSGNGLLATTGNIISTSNISVVASSVPTSDMITIDNTGYGVTTAGTNALQINYSGGSAAVEAGAVRVAMTPGGTAGGVWNAFRYIPTAAAGLGVTINGFKADNKSAGAGTSNVLFAGTGYDNIINYNGTSIIWGNGQVNGSQVVGGTSSSGVTTGTVITTAQGWNLP